MAKLTLVSPIEMAVSSYWKYNITQWYGKDKTDPAYLHIYTELGLLGHNGIDFRAIHGQKVYAAHDGTVTYSGLDGANGYLVVVKTDKQYEYNGGEAYYKTLYGHLLPPMIVSAGQKVKAGDLIAYADNTGKSVGDHLHFGLKPVQQGEADWQWYNVVQENGYNGAIDPEPYFALRDSGQFANPSDIRSIMQSIDEIRDLIAKVVAKKK